MAQPERGFTVHIPALRGPHLPRRHQGGPLQNIWEAIELYLEPAAEELVQYEGERVEIALGGSRGPQSVVPESCTNISGGFVQ